MHLAPRGLLWLTVDCAERGFGDKGMIALCQALIRVHRPLVFPRLLFYKLRLTDASMPHVRLFFFVRAIIHRALCEKKRNSLVGDFGFCPP